MAMENPFDLIPSDYATAPAGLDVASTLALGHRLLSVAPAELPDHAVVNRNLLRTSITLLGHAYGLMQGAGPTPLRRPIDQCTDKTWGCIKRGLELWTALEDSDHKNVVPARELERKIFPDDSLSFLALEYNAQWAEANWRIELLERENLLPVLRRLIDDVFVDKLLFWHARYTEMLGISAEATATDGKSASTKKPKAKAKKPTPSPATVDGASDLSQELTVGELRRRAQQAIVGWQITLVTLHMSGHKGARAALAPTDEFRERALSGRTSAEVEPSPSATTSPQSPADSEASAG